MNTINTNFEAPNIINTFLDTVRELDFYLQSHCKYYLSFSFDNAGQAVVLVEAHHIAGRFSEFEFSIEEFKNMIECNDELDEWLSNAHKQLAFILQNHNAEELKQILEPCGLKIYSYKPGSVCVTAKRHTLFISGV